MKPIGVRLPWVQQTGLSTDLVYHKIKSGVFSIFVFIIPFAALFFLNLGIICAIYRSHKFRTKINATNSGGNFDHERAITIMLVTIVVVFLVCDTPTLFANMFASYLLSYLALQYILPWSQLILIAKPLINTAIYFFFISRFREAVRPHLFWLIDLRKNRIIVTSSDSSRTNNNKNTQNNHKYFSRELKKTLETEV